ncbi:unnamed protein product [Phaeothamnion confervicola]
MRAVCTDPSCSKPAYYNTPGETKPRFCGKHKSDSMINVHNKLCQRQPCGKRPHYGPPGGVASFCVTHKELGMINVHGRLCQSSMCGKQPTFAFRGEKVCGDVETSLVKLPSTGQLWPERAKDQSGALRGAPPQPFLPSATITRLTHVTRLSSAAAAPPLPLTADTKNLTASLLRGAPTSTDD